MLRQHEEIDRLNERMRDFRILKGIEADILADGRLDYDPTILDSFDYVVGSIHSRFSMDGDAMTKRVLAALDDPHLTILAHRRQMLLSREPYGSISRRCSRRQLRWSRGELNADRTGSTSMALLASGEGTLGPIEIG